MTTAGQPHVLLPVLIVAFVAWRLYARGRRLVGRQRWRPLRSWISLVVFPALVLLLVGPAMARPLGGLALAGGVATGALLGLWGLRLTKFEPTSQGLYYTPDARIGLALMLLLVLRVVFRLARMASGALPEAGDPGLAFVRSPLTLLLFGSLAGYYVSYAIGLLRFKGGVQPAA